MTKDEVKKEVSEEETKDSDGEALGCFWWFFAVLVLALFMLPSLYSWFFKWMLH